MKEREKWREGSRYYDVKLIYLDALAAVFMNHRGSDSLIVFLLMQIIQGKAELEIWICNAPDILAFLPFCKRL